MFWKRKENEAGNESYTVVKTAFDRYMENAQLLMKERQENTERLSNKIVRSLAGKYQSINLRSDSEFYLKGYSKMLRVNNKPSVRLYIKEDQSNGASLCDLYINDVNINQSLKDIDQVYLSKLLYSEICVPVLDSEAEKLLDELLNIRIDQDNKTINNETR